jgi:hypothetical protein
MIQGGVGYNDVFPRDFEIDKQRRLSQVSAPAYLPASSLRGLFHLQCPSALGSSDTRQTSIPSGFAGVSAGVIYSTTTP